MMTFPRGNGPLVSVLLPTRRRTNKLLESLNSLVSLSYNPSDIEIIFKIDDDDYDTSDFLKDLVIKLPTKTQVLSSTRGNGYHDMHTWFNSMCQVAGGDWLLVWNDDAMMVTDKWDYILSVMQLSPSIWHGVMDICCLVPEIQNEPGCTALFFLRRKVVQLIDCFARIPHCDTWVSKLMQSIESLFFIPYVQVKHAQEKDQLFLEGEPARATTKYTVHNKGATLARLQDAIKLQEYIDSNRRI